MLNFTPFLAAMGDPGLSEKLSATAEKLATTFHVDWHFFLAQVLNFGITAFVLYRYAFKPVMATVDERNKKIAEGLQYTEDMKKKLADTAREQAEILKKASLEAQKVINESRETGKAIEEKATQEAIRLKEDIVKKGHQEAELEHQQMLNDLRREVAQLVVNTTSRVLSRDLTPEERSRFAATAAADLSKN